MKTKDAEAVHALLSNYLKNFKTHFEMSLAEFKHFVLPRDGVVDAFVVEDPETKKITDFFSFYHLPSTILRHDEHKLLKVAYSFYNVPGKYSLKELVKEALILAKNKEFDVYNALDIMENNQFLEDLNFGIGDGHLHYYLYNWRVRE